MLSYEEIREIVKNTLTEKRFYHSECVANRCAEYGKIYGEDEEICKIAGIVHDIAREIPNDEIFKKCDEYGIELDQMEKIKPFIIHSKLGAIIAKKDFGLDDYICNSIKCHTTGKENMTRLDKILFLADKTGEDREYEGVNNIYELAKKDLDLALIEAFKNSITYVLKNNELIHPDTLFAYNYLVKNM